MPLTNKHRLLLFLCITCLLPSCQAQVDQNTSQSPYEIKTHSRDGIGKYYFNREIAHVMGHQAAGWLERSEREEEEKTSTALKNFQWLLKDKDQACMVDLGAGAGYYSVPLAKMFPKGWVYALDIQQEMLELIEAKIKKDNIPNLKTLLSTEEDIPLPEDSIDLIFMVDVYHELSKPYEIMQKAMKVLKKEGFLVLIEFKTEDPNVPIKALHKMSQKQAVKELESVGFEFVENRQNLPWQHFLVFRKPS